jgi:hypothetical protein
MPKIFGKALGSHGGCVGGQPKPEARQTPARDHKYRYAAIAVEGFQVDPAISQTVSESRTPSGVEQREPLLGVLTNAPTPSPSPCVTWVTWEGGSLTGRKRTQFLVDCIPSRLARDQDSGSAETRQKRGPAPAVRGTCGYGRASRTSGS